MWSASTRFNSISHIVAVASGVDIFFTPDRETLIVTINESLDNVHFFDVDAMED